MLENLFVFPIVMIDGDEMQEKDKLNALLNKDDDDDLEAIHGEAEVPYFDLVGLVDKWGPNRESKERARRGVFDHCMVIFQTAGIYLSPMSKREFKKKFEEFADKRVKDDAEKIIQAVKVKKNVRKPDIQ